MNEESGPGFWKGEDGRIRCGWRVVLILIAYQLAQFLVGAVLAAALVAGFMMGGGGVPSEEWITSTILPLVVFTSSLCFIPVIFLFRRGLDRRSVRSMGFGPIRVEMPRWLLGFALGASVIGAQVAVAAVVGDVHRFPASEPITERLAGMSSSFLLLFLAALMEEVLARGYIQGNLTERVGPFFAVLISALIFSVLHGQNEGLEGVRTLAMLNLFLAGVFLGVVYQKTRSLPVVWGLHMGWNLFLGPVFGTPVSGLGFAGLFPLGLELPRQLGGGAFGLEGGLICTGVLSGAIGVFWSLSRRRPSSGP